MSGVPAVGEPGVLVGYKAGAGVGVDSKFSDSWGKTGGMAFEGGNSTTNSYYARNEG